VPVYEQTYRHYEAREALRQTRFWPITREALRLVLSRRAFVVLLMGAWLPFAGFSIYLYVLTQTQLGPMAQVLPVGGPLYLRFYAWQMPIAFVLTTFAASGLVANDRRTGALVVYLSRPLTRRDYVVGKLAVPLLLTLFVTAVPALLLYLVGLALVPSLLLTRAHAWLAPSVGVQGLLVSMTISLVALAVSALSKSARAAGLAFFGLLMMLDVVQGVLQEIYDKPYFALLSPQANLRLLGEAMLGGPAPALPWYLPALVLAATGAACLLVLRRQVRAVEIVT
jgi:hypothetical protein